MKWRTGGEFSFDLSIAVSSPAVTFPEAVALAEILTDPAWRRYAAATPARRAGQFYRRISERLSEGTYQAPAGGGPVIAWVEHHCQFSVDLSPSHVKWRTGGEFLSGLPKAGAVSGFCVLSH